MTCEARRHDATGYQRYGCRCDEGKAAQAKYAKMCRTRKHRGVEVHVDACGVRRRMQALAYMGWPRHELMARMGFTDSGTWLYERDTYHVTTVAKVRAIYDELWDKPGPSRWTAVWARNKGFLPPMAWGGDIDNPEVNPAKVKQPGVRTDKHVDEIAVRRYAAGDDIRLTSAEKGAAWLLMTRKLGVSKKEANDRLHLAWRDVQRIERSGDEGLSTAVKPSVKPTVSRAVLTVEATTTTEVA